MKTIKKISLISAFLLGASSAASAHSLTGQSLGTAVSATDYHQVTCTPDEGGVNTATMQAQIKDATSGSNILSLTIQKGLRATKTTDVTGANATFSPKASLSGGNGVYNVLVTKTIAGARNYSISFHCMNGSLHTGTSVATKQNQ